MSKQYQFYDRHHGLINRCGIFVSQMTTEMFLLIFLTFRSFIHSWIITGFVTRVTRHVPHVEQELLIRPEHLRSPTDFSEVRVALSLVVCGVLCRSLFVFLSLFFWDHGIVYPSIYSCWLPLFWYLQTCLIHSTYLCNNSCTCTK